MHDHIRQSNLIEGIDWPIADQDCMKAWLWLLQQKKLDHGIIGHLQRQITRHQKDLNDDQRGAYRKINVAVGKAVPPHHTMVKGLMDNWLLDYKKMWPLDAHVRFEKIHPFVDGNGRTGRMLLWWQELHNGHLPTLFKASDSQEYYKLFT